METCNMETEVFSRVVGYYRPIRRWNDGKKEEFRDRVTFSQSKALERDFTLMKNPPVEQEKDAFNKSMDELICACSQEAPVLEAELHHEAMMVVTPSH